MFNFPRDDFVTQSCFFFQVSFAILLFSDRDNIVHPNKLNPCLMTFKASAIKFPRFVALSYFTKRTCTVLWSSTLLIQTLPRECFYMAYTHRFVCMADSLLLR